MRGRFGAGLAAATVVVLWGSAYPAIRVGLRSYSPTHLALLRYLVASMVLLALAPLLRVRRPRAADVPLMLLLGLIGITAYNLCLNIGETHVTAGAASLLVNTVPVLTSVLAWLFLGERLGPLGWTGMALSFFGAAIIAAASTGDHSLSPWAAIVMVAALCQAIFFVVQKPLLTRYRPLDLTCYAIWAGTLGALVFAPGLVQAVRQAPTSATIAVAYLGVFPASVAYFAWAIVLSRLPTQRASSLLFAVPVLSFLIAWGWLGEAPRLLAVLGGVLALGGVALVHTRALAGPRPDTTRMATPVLKEPRMRRHLCGES